MQTPQELIAYVEDDAQTEIPYRYLVQLLWLAGHPIDQMEITSSDYLKMDPVGVKEYNIKQDIEKAKKRLLNREIPEEDWLEAIELDLDKTPRRLLAYFKKMRGYRVPNQYLIQLLWLAGEPIIHMGITRSNYLKTGTIDIQGYNIEHLIMKAQERLDSHEVPKDWLKAIEVEFKADPSLENLWEGIQ